MQGTVAAINRSEKKGDQKKPIAQGVFIEDFGLEGDAHAGKEHRQVSLMGQESIDKMNALGVMGLCSGNFTENITTRGLVLYELAVGTKLMIGETLHEVTQIGKKCHGADCAVMQQIGDCIMPREGIFTKVLRGGTVHPGDAITVAESTDL